MPFQKVLFSLFILIALSYLTAVILDFEPVNFYLKPLLLLPLLAISFFSIAMYDKRLLFAALFFCWAGDVLLLFVSTDATFFILGLSSFLIGHLFYILIFIRMSGRSGKKQQINLPFLFFIIFYLLLFYWLMSPHLGAMLVPVMVYAVVISAMLYFAFLLRTQIRSANSVYIFMGATAFVISDSILAVNKFYTAIPISGFLIMITYIFAQGAIVWGIAGKHEDKKNLRLKR